MKFTVNINKVLLNLFGYFIALGIVFNCRSIWGYLLNTMSYFPNITKLLIILGVFGSIIVMKKIPKKKVVNTFFIVVMLLLYGIFYIILQPYNRIGFLLFIVMVLLIMNYYYLCEGDNEVPSLIYKYQNIIIFIAIISLVFWFFGSVLGVFTSNKVVWTTWTLNGDPEPLNSYFNIYFEGKKSLVFSTFKIVRNIAIFTEPPMASLNFSIAFLIEYLLKEKKSIYKIIILILSVISTFSTTGYIVIILAFVLKYLFTNKTSMIKKIIKVIALPLTFIIAFSFVYKLFIMKLDTSSGNIRFDDFIVGFKAWKHSPIIGSGFGNSDILKLYMGRWRSFNTGFSNSIMEILAQGGIYLILPYLFSYLIGIIKSVRSKNKYYLIFIICLLYLFTITICSYQYIIILLLLFFAVGKKQKTNY